MRLTDNEFHTKESKERVCYVEEPRLQAIYDKLFDLEDIEDELGIDLITLFKALKQGIWIKKWLKEKYPLALMRRDYCGGTTKYFVFINNKEKEIKLKDYGKTWALTREELL